MLALRRAPDARSLSTVFYGRLSMVVDRVQTRAGSLGAWLWAEDGSVDVNAADVVAGLAQRLVGMRGVCTSWDSGFLDVGVHSLIGWEMRGRWAVSPVVDEGLASSWPSSGSDWDEWYFFREVPAFGRLRPFCNWGLSVAEARDIEHAKPSGFSLLAQLNRYHPDLVVGEGQRVFALSEDSAAIAEFSRLCSRRRTSG